MASQPNPLVSYLSLLVQPLQHRAHPHCFHVVERRYVGTRVYDFFLYVVVENCALTIVLELEDAPTPIPSLIVPYDRQTLFVPIFFGHQAPNGVPALTVATTNTRYYRFRRFTFLTRCLNSSGSGSTNTPPTYRVPAWFQSSSVS